MQIVTFQGTRSAVASGKSLYPVEMPVGSLSYARDLLRVAWENPLVSYPILDPCRRFMISVIDHNWAFQLAQFPVSYIQS